MQALRASIVFAISMALSCFASGAPTKPLGAGRLLALVAGGALPENVVREVRTSGLAFRPDDDYRALLKAAGADESILSAINAAAGTTTGAAEGKADDARLQHLSHAGELM